MDTLTAPTGAGPALAMQIPVAYLHVIGNVFGATSVNFSPLSPFHSVIIIFNIPLFILFISIALSAKSLLLSNEGEGGVIIAR
jgi:hypothetical protein